jgi:hypothetical protein
LIKSERHALACLERLLRRREQGWRHYLERLRLVGGGHAVPAHTTPPELVAGIERDGNP